MEDKKKKPMEFGLSFWPIRMHKELQAKGVPEEEISKIVAEAQKRRKQIEKEILEI